jgi:chromosome segregation ATPase
MSPREDDHMDDGPKITPDFDEIESFQRTKAKGSLSASLGEVPDTAVSGGGSKTLLLVMGVIMLLLGAWAGFLHMQLQATAKTLENYELRVADLEQRLSVTDESLNESGVAMKVKIREMDSEIRKLWDNVWKKSKQTFAEHKALLAKQAKNIQSNQQVVSSLKQQLSSNDDVITTLQEQLVATQTMRKQLESNQQQLLSQQRNIENTADKVNRVTTTTTKLDKRVKSTEEWIESINGFRRQVNRDIDTLKQSVVQLQAQP